MIPDLSQTLGPQGKIAYRQIIPLSPSAAYRPERKDMHVGGSSAARTASGRRTTLAGSVQRN